MALLTRSMSGVMLAAGVAVAHHVSSARIPTAAFTASCRADEPSSGGAHGEQARVNSIWNTKHGPATSMRWSNVA